MYAHQHFLFCVWTCHAMPVECFPPFYLLIPHIGGVTHLGFTDSLAPGSQNSGAPLSWHDAMTTQQRQ